MKSKLTLQYCIAVMILFVAIQAHSQSKNDSLQHFFSAKEISQIHKGDDLLRQGLDMDSELDSLLNVYSKLDKNTSIANRKLSNTENNELTNSLRALRVYYVGTSKITDVYLKHIKSKDFQNNQNLDVEKLLTKCKDNSNKAHTYFKKSRDTRHIEDAVKYAVFSIDVHQKLQTELYEQLYTNQYAIKETSKPVEPTVNNTIPVLESAVTIAVVEEISKPAIVEPPIKKETIIVTKASPPKETVVEAAGPETYFTIQIMADKKQASDAQLATIYFGKRKTIMNKGDGWYRYSVGKFKQYEKAYSAMKSEKIKGYVVAYHGNKRISAPEAKAILKATP